MGTSWRFAKCADKLGLLVEDSFGGRSSLGDCKKDRKKTAGGSHLHATSKSDGFKTMLFHWILSRRPLFESGNACSLDHPPALSTRALEFQPASTSINQHQTSCNQLEQRGGKCGVRGRMQRERRRTVASKHAGTLLPTTDRLFPLRNA